MQNEFRYLKAKNRAFLVFSLWAGKCCKMATFCCKTIILTCMEAQSRQEFWVLLVGLEHLRPTSTLSELSVLPGTIRKLEPRLVLKGHFWAPSSKYAVLLINFLFLSSIRTTNTMLWAYKVIPIPREVT